MSSFEGYLSPGTPGQDSLQKGTQRARLHPPSLLIQANTVVLSVAIRTMLFKQRSWNSFRARKNTFSSRWFMCSLLSGRDQVPLAVCSFKWAPHISFYASVKICRSYFSGCNGWPWIVPPTTIFSEGGVTWGLVSPFLVTLEPSSCSSSGTICVSYGADLGE